MLFIEGITFHLWHNRPKSTVFNVDFIFCCHLKVVNDDLYEIQLLNFIYFIRKYSNHFLTLDSWGSTNEHFTIAKSDSLVIKNHVFTERARAKDSLNGL